MKAYYIICWNNGKMERYIDNDNSEHGTGIEEYAKPFDTKEEAQSFIDAHGYENCGVQRVEPIDIETEETE